MAEPPKTAPGAPDPSMEDILASIRRILDDETPAGTAGEDAGDDVLDLTETGDGVRIFIGSENRLFSLTGSTLVVSPYMNAERRIVGAVGVIGPTRLNYGRIVPIVDYTAQLIGRMLGELHSD